MPGEKSFAEQQVGKNRVNVNSYCEHRAHTVIDHKTKQSCGRPPVAARGGADMEVVGQEIVPGKGAAEVLAVRADGRGGFGAALDGDGASLDFVGQKAYFSALYVVEEVLFFLRQTRT